MAREIGGPPARPAVSGGGRGGIPQRRCEWASDQPPAALQDLDSLLGVSDGEDPLVQVVELRHHLVDVLWSARNPLAQRQLERPDLVSVTRLQEVLVVSLARVSADGGAERFE